MHVQVHIMVMEEDESPGSPEECANTILAALKGDPSKDICSVQMTSVGSYGAKGAVPGAPVPEPPKIDG